MIVCSVSREGVPARAFGNPSAVLALSLLFSITGCSGGEPGAEAAPASKGGLSAKPRAERIETNIPDIVLVDQNGELRRFYSDLVEGKIVLMNAVYTSCAGTCPMQTSIFASVQRHLGDRVGRDVQMISVSLDPTTDRPDKLKEFAERYGAKPGWVFLTGSKEDVKTVLEAVDLYAAVPEEHTPICAVGNDETGVWMKLINLSSPHEIVKRLEYVAQLDPSHVVGE
jgi:protein SCO1/2